jgi:hypothetical protein
MAEITYQMVLSTFQTVGILVGIFYYVTSLRNQNKARQAQLIARLYDKYSEPEFLRRPARARFISLNRLGKRVL